MSKLIRCILKTSFYKILLFILASYFLLSLVHAQDNREAVVRGQVADEKGNPMQYANVQVVDSFDGDVTDAMGRFLFETRHLGRQKVRATSIGYEAGDRGIELSAGDTVDVHIVLKEKYVEMDEVVISASAFSTGDEKGVTLRGLEVVTTPGAAADIFLAIKSFPGVAMIDEGSGLFIRGGDVTETVTLLDQATVVHPYKYESPTGGVFGTISPFLVKGTFFSAGGFSARYGNALSGILAMESQDIPERSEYIFGVGLAAASLGINKSLAHGKFGIRFSGNRSFTEVMFRLNGRHDEFTLTPRGMDGNLSLIYRYSATGKIKLFNFAADDRLGVRVDEPSFDGVYRGEENNRLHNLQWSDIIQGWLARASLSLNRFKSERDFGNLNFDQRDETDKLRLDLQKALGSRLNLYTGFEFERTHNKFVGEVPFYRNVLDPESEVYTLKESYAADRAGAYLEAEGQLSRRWFAGLGARIDHHNLADQTTIDPRLSVRYQWSKSTNLRFSSGIYHQFPQPYLFNEVSGSPNLGSQKAEHYIATIEHSQGQFMLRLEPYYKSYENLVIEDNDENFSNRGDGYSRGIDLFLKYGAYLQTRFNGWISYSYLQSKRIRARDNAGSYTFEKAASPFDITHNLTLVAKTRFYQYLSIGFSYRYATGRPITPIEASIKQEPFDYYLPVEGPVSSERLPSFQRFDTTLSYYLPFGFGNAAVFYLSLSNLFDRANIIDYDYSADYSTRKLRKTNYRRFIYFGVSVSFMG
jgi:hypothetical protein